MGSSIVALTGSFVAMILSVLWLLLLFAPMNWFWTENGIITVHLSLLSMSVSQGTVLKIGGLVLSAFDDKKAKAFRELTNNNHWLDEGTTQLCSPLWETVYHWCDEWKMAKYGSLTMLVFGVFAAICLAAGGFMGYYYNQVHSTKTGRIATISCYVSAVTLLFTGLLLYMCLTIQTGMGVGRYVGNDTWMYCSGVLLACVLTLLSGVPLYLQLMYAKKWGDEWKGAEFDERYEAGTYGGGSNATYGASNPYGSGATPGYGTPGYGTPGYGTTGYGTAGQPPAVYGAAFVTVQQTPYPVPGSGRAAW